MKSDFPKARKSAPKLPQVYWSRACGFRRLLHPHPDMLRPEGLAKPVDFNPQLWVESGFSECCEIVFDYRYVLRCLPELSGSIPEGLEPGSLSYLEALREELSQHIENQPIETWSDVVERVRCQLKLSQKEMVRMVDGSASIICAWETGRQVPTRRKFLLNFFRILRDSGNHELLERAKEILIAHLQAKLDDIQAELDGK